MSTHDMIIDNAVGATVRADMNSALAALVSNSSSATEPATMYAYQWWADTTTGLLKQRNAANSAWITIGTLASTNLGLAVVSGSASQVFSVGDPTNAAHAVPADWVGYFPTVASATTVDIFGAAGATINLTGTTTVTTITDCTAAQVGSTKRIITAGACPVTASASLTVDGAASGTYTMPAGAKLEILATSTTTFSITTISAQGTFTLAAVCGTSGTITMGNATGRWIKTGPLYNFTGFFDVSSVSSPVGTLTLTTDIPGTAGNNNYNYSAVAIRIYTTNASTGIIYQGSVAKNTNSIEINYYAQSTGTEGSNMAGQIKANSVIILSGNFIVS